MSSISNKKRDLDSTSSTPTQKTKKQQTNLFSFFKNTSTNTPSNKSKPIDSTKTPLKSNGITPKLENSDSGAKKRKSRVIDSDDDDDDDIVQTNNNINSSKESSNNNRNPTKQLRFDEMNEDLNDNNEESEKEEKPNISEFYDKTLEKKLSSFEYDSSIQETDFEKENSLIDKRTKNALQKSLTKGSNYDENEEGIERDITSHTRKPEWLAHPRDAAKRKPDHPDYDPTTLYIPDSEYSKLSVMMKQYWDYKKAHMNELVFLQWGAFYEVLWDDADVCHRELGIQYTKRAKSTLLSAGIPVGSYESNVKVLVARGYVVTMFTQLPKVGKKDIERAPSRTASIGTAIADEWLPDHLNGYLAAIVECQPDDLNTSSEGAAVIGVCLADVTTGDVFLGQFEDDAQRTMLDSVFLSNHIRELLIARGAEKITANVARRHVPTSLTHIIKEFPDATRVIDQLERAVKREQWPQLLREMTTKPMCMSAVGAVLQRVRESNGAPVHQSDVEQRTTAASVDSMLFDGALRPLDCDTASRSDQAEFVRIDGKSLGQLGVLPAPNTPDATDGTLVQHLDRCCTPFGRRLLRLWLSHPLRQIKDIEARLDSVEELRDDTVGRAVRGVLKPLPDIERKLTSLCAGRLSSRDFLALLEAFDRTQRLIDSDLFESDLLKSLSTALKPFGLAVEKAESLFDREQSAIMSQFVCREGADPHFDKVKSDRLKYEKELDNHLKEMKSTLNCSSMKYIHPNSKGALKFQIEVPVKTKVPSDWRELSKTSKVKRYHSPTVSELLPKLESLTTEEAVLEAAAFCTTQRAVGSAMQLSNQTESETKDKRHSLDLRSACRALASIDVLQAFAVVASELSLRGPVCRPQLVNDKTRGGALFDAKACWHPCLDAPIANDIHLDGAGQSFALLGGANMGGKTTLLRCTALTTILAQIGSFVPAQSLRMSPADAILTRIGASDNILLGQSTFMVEMLETSTILRNATSSSLVLLDELGRGTSTSDGLSIANAVVDALLRRSARSIFATHYHKLNAIYANNSRVALWKMKVSIDNQGQLTPLFKRVNGAAVRSFGAEVALMAGLPKSVADNATNIAQQSARNAGQRWLIGALSRVVSAIDSNDAPTLTNELNVVGTGLQLLEQQEAFIDANQ